MIDFTRVKATQTAVDDKTFKLCVMVKGGKVKEFEFRTLRDDQLGTWISYINLNMNNPVIEFFNDHQTGQDEVPEYAPRKFWKVCQITNKELQDVAQTGDLLLFSGTQMQAQILRGLMRSKWDHIGMFVRYPKSG